MSVSVCSFCLAEEEANFIKVDRSEMIKFLCTEFERDLVTRSCSRPEERPQPFPFVISLCSKCHVKYEEIYKLHTLMVNVSRDIIKLLSEVRTMMSKVDLERAQLTAPTKSRPALENTICKVVEPEVEVLEPEVEAAHSNSGADAEGEVDVVSPEMKLEDEPYSITFVSLEPHLVDLPVNKNSSSIFIDESESLEIEIKDEEPRAPASGEFGWFDALDEQNNELLIKEGPGTIKDPLGPLEFQPASISIKARLPMQKKGRPKKYNVKKKSQVNSTQKTLPNPYVSLVSISNVMDTRSEIKESATKKTRKCENSFKPITDQVCPPSNHKKKVKNGRKSWKGKKKRKTTVCLDCNEKFKWTVQLFRHRSIHHKQEPVALEARNNIEAVSDTQSDNEVQIDSVSDIDLQEPASPEECQDSQDIQASPVEYQDTQASPVEYQDTQASPVECQDTQASPSQSQQPVARSELKNPASPVKSRIKWVKYQATMKSSKRTRRVEKVTSAHKIQEPVAVIESQDQEPITTMDNEEATQSAFPSDDGTPDVPKSLSSKLTKTSRVRKRIIEKIPIVPLRPVTTTCKLRLASLDYNREAFLANDKIPTALKLFYSTLSSAQNEMINKLISPVPTPRPPCIKPQEHTSLDNGGSTISALDPDDEIPVFRKSRIIKTYGLQKPTVQNISMDEDEDPVPPKPSLPFPCQNCKERFATLYDLNIHTNRNHCEGINCTEPDCKQVLASFAALENHIRMRHFPSKHSVCLGCKKKYGISREFNFHLKGNTTCSEFAIRCNECDFPRKYFPSKKALELHNKHWHIKPSLGRFACSFHGCGRKFDSRSQLKRHDIPAHSGQIYPCEKCQKPFKTHYHLKGHMKAVHLSKEPGAKKFTCNTCQLVFRNQSTLHCHEQLHREDTPFLCSVCGKGYKVRTHLNVHMWSHDPDRYEKYSLYSYKNNPKKSKPATTRMKRSKKRNAKAVKVPEQVPATSSSVTEESTVVTKPDSLQGKDPDIPLSGEVANNKTSEVSSSTRILSLGDELRLNEN